MKTNEFKRELSKLSGIDFFNPKYRELFKKAFPAEEPADEQEEKEIPKVAETEEKEADKKEVVDKEEDIEKAEDEREIDKIEREKAETPEKREEKAEEEREETHQIGKDVDELKEDKTTDELLEAKIENELLRGGVREEKLGAAMRLARSEVKSLDELGKVREILQDFPEWVRSFKAKGFGMDVDNDSDNLTEEEKRLKQMGIDPRE